MTFKTYNSQEEYETELGDWVRSFIELYSSYAVEVSEEGDISHIKGKLLYQKELQKLCDLEFSDIEVKEYHDKTDQMKEQMNAMHRKSAEYIKQGEMISMEYLFRMFHFSDFEWFVFCMAFVQEQDTQMSRVFCLLQDDFQRTAPSLELCIRIYTLVEAERMALQKEIWRNWEFMESFFPNLRGADKRSGAVFEIPLLIDKRILRFVSDIGSDNDALEGIARLIMPETKEHLEPILIQQKSLNQLELLYQSMKLNHFLYLCGEKGSGKKFMMRHLCSHIKKPLLFISAKQLPEKGEQLRAITKEIFREARLKGEAVICFADLYFEEDEPKQRAIMELLISLIFEHQQKVLFTSTQPLCGDIDTNEMIPVEFTLPQISMEEREILWKAWLKDEVSDLIIERLADRYRLTPGMIKSAVEETKQMKQIKISENENKHLDFLYSAAQKQLVHKLGKDAIRIDGRYQMKDLILPSEQKKLLADACNLVQYHHQIYDKWGFHNKVAYGRGASMIFYGPPGTGKTMGAQAMARELRMELYKVDMAGILSKYVGESEKKLGNIFEQGTKSQSILFFDEADALFGKRSEVKDAQDKYANASTAYLLQKIEEYEGIIILATNLLQNFDAAFCRRFKFIIEFPFPDEERRKEIWENVFPTEMPRHDIDYDYLAKEYTFSGSQIKNIAVAAAFLAAGEQDSLRMQHILQALKREMKKTGKNMIPGDFGKYYSLMESY